MWIPLFHLHLPPLDGHSITIVGNPNLGRVKVAMIGLRNPKDEGVAGKEICGEVWVNEFQTKRAE